MLSLFLILMTIGLTVMQAGQSQDNRSSAVSKKKKPAITNKKNSDKNTKPKTDKQNTNKQNKNKQSSASSKNPTRTALDEINAFRKSNRLGTLQVQTNLQNAADWMSKDQSQQKKMSHIDSKGRDPEKRVQEFKYQYTIMVENVGEGTTDGKAIVNAWIKSPEHKKNLLCKDCTQIGLAEVNGYWTMDAGNPLRNPTVSQSPSTKPSVSPSISQNPTSPSPSRPTTSGSPSPSVSTANGTKVELQIDIPGVIDNPVYPERYVTLTLENAAKKSVTTVEGTVIYESAKKSFIGTIDLPDTVTTGSYLFKVRTDYSLTETISSGYLYIQKGKITTLPSVELAVLDFDENETISLLDFLVLRECLDTDCGDESVDVNDDGVVDILDYNIAVEYFGKAVGD